MKFLFTTTVLALALSIALPAEPMEIKTFEATGTSPASIQYIFYLPASASSSNKSPLILFLHGSGGRGTNIAKLLGEGLPKAIDMVPSFPMAVAAPQLSPSNRGWYEISNTIVALVDEILATNPIDPERVYLTGLSMGG
ncbi:MAG: phospholipase, partial [Spirochaetia bacterium]|nr:phospholipase [Spirochaetia bacterium]